MNSKLPIGIDSFKDLREGGYYYVDKSKFIMDILMDGLYALLITRPYGFGKTLNMSMLAEYFDIQKKSAHLFQDLEIANTNNWTQMNTAPVLHFSFAKCRGDMESIILSTKEELLREFKRHKKEINPQGPFEQSDFSRLLDCLNNGKIDVLNINHAIIFLCEQIFRFYRLKPIILIDGYDTPFISAYMHGCYQELSNFFTILYGSAIKGNPFLERSIITGVQQIVVGEEFSSLNNLVSCSIYDSRYIEYFGISGHEKTALLYHTICHPHHPKNSDGSYSFLDHNFLCPESLFRTMGGLAPEPCGWSEKQLRFLFLKYGTGNPDSSSFFNRLRKLLSSDNTLVTAGHRFHLCDELNEADLWRFLLDAGWIVGEELDVFIGLYRVSIQDSYKKDIINSLLKAAAAERADKPTRNVN